MKSVTKLKTNEILGGIFLNQKINPQIISRDEDRDNLAMLIRAYFDDLKGYHIQYNAVSKEVLFDAQRHPEKHKVLIIRVAGYSAFFIVLSTEMQNDIIARTEQTI